MQREQGEAIRLPLRSPELECIREEIRAAAKGGVYRRMIVFGLSAVG